MSPPQLSSAFVLFCAVSIGCGRTANAPGSESLAGLQANEQAGEWNKLAKVATLLLASVNPAFGWQTTAHGLDVASRKGLAVNLHLPATTPWEPSRRCKALTDVHMLLGPRRLWHQTTTVLSHKRKALRRQRQEASSRSHARLKSLPTPPVQPTSRIWLPGLRSPFRDFGFGFGVAIGTFLGRPSGYVLSAAIAAFSLMREFARDKDWDDDDDEFDDEDEEGESEYDIGSILSFDKKPRDIVEYLDKYVVEQTDAKQALAVAICDHYNNVRRYLGVTSLLLESNASEQLFAIAPNAQRSNNYAKPNILLTGPTGVGKTYIIKSLARLIGVPFVKSDATKFSETGFVGREAESVVRDLVAAAGEEGSKVAQFGIVYMDEFDKLVAPNSNTISQSKRGVQNNLLKLLEDTDVNISPLAGLGVSLPGTLMGAGRRGKSKKTINTRNILFIFSGAFTGLESEIKRRKEQKSFGFTIDNPSPQANPANAGDGDAAAHSPTNTRSYLRYAETADFVSAGLEPELMGRIPVRVALDALSVDNLKTILTKAEDSVLKQFKHDFEGYSINMSATDDALTQVATLAEKEGSGARGLVTVLERTLRGHKYELPSSSVRAFELDNATVVSPAEGLAKLLKSGAANYDRMDGIF